MPLERLPQTKRAAQVGADEESKMNCEFCHKDEDLVEYDGEMFCRYICLDIAKENARINEREKVLEERRLTKERGL